MQGRQRTGYEERGQPVANEYPLPPYLVRKVFKRLDLGVDLRVRGVEFPRKVFKAETLAPDLGTLLFRSRPTRGPLLSTLTGMPPTRHEVRHNRAMPSLWSPDSWPQRLSELLASTGSLKAAPLRRDVRSLGMLLGQVLREQAEPGIYESVERLRQAAIARREQAEATPDLPNVRVTRKTRSARISLPAPSPSTSSSSTSPKPTTASAVASLTSSTKQLRRSAGHCVEPCALCAKPGSRREKLRSF
jgi:hypothetical protein